MASSSLLSWMLIFKAVQIHYIVQPVSLTDFIAFDSVIGIVIVMCVYVDFKFTIVEII